MIVTAVGKVILSLLNALFFFELPSIPDSVITVFNNVLGYLNSGLDMIHLLIGNTAFGVVGACLKLILLANGVYFVVSLVFFVLKKIPFLGLKE